MKHTKWGYVLLFSFFLTIGYSQQFLQIEKYGSPFTEKLPIGSIFEYRLTGDDFYSFGEIEGIDIDNNLIVLPSRYVALDKIHSLRFKRSWPKAIGTSLFFFGIGWSTFAAIGTATDNDPTTNYRWSDAVVTGSAVAASFGVSRLFKFRVVRVGKRYRLRLLDISFGPPKNN